MNHKPSSYKQLLDYQKQGFLFHGSTNPNISILEPKAATDADKDNNFNNDTAIFATTLPEASVLFACNSIDIVPEKIGGGTWVVEQAADGTITATFPKKWQPYITQNKGYVYILKQETFSGAGGWQVKSKQAVTPTAKIEVSFPDFEKLGGRIIWKDETNDIASRGEII